MRKGVEYLRNDVGREQSENVAMKAAIDQQRRKIEELEGSSQIQEGTKARQLSEIEDLKAGKKKCKNDLKPSIEASEAQGRGVEQLKHENTALKATKDRLMENVGERRDPTDGFASSQAVPLSVKTAKRKD
jgi:TolA-binding protein